MLKTAAELIEEWGEGGREKTHTGSFLLTLQEQRYMLQLNRMYRDAAYNTAGLHYFACH